MRLGYLMIAAMLAGSGCGNSPPKSYEDLQREYDAKVLQTHPVGRYQFIGKQVYADGTIEYSCLDTSTGEIGYATIYPDPKKPSTFNCAD